eukprot:3853695-Rhodomonas_salina.1
MRRPVLRSAIVVRIRYATSGTEIGYGGTAARSSRSHTASTLFWTTTKFCCSSRARYVIACYYCSSPPLGFGARGRDFAPRIRNAEIFSRLALREQVQEFDSPSKLAKDPDS